MKSPKLFPITVLVLLILVSFFFVFSSFAQTFTPDIQAIIKQLQDQIKLLNQQILDLQSRLEKTEEEVQTVKAELKLTRSLRKGESNDEVRQLQEFLKQFPDIYPEGIVTGFFGSLTELAVKRFQEKNGIESIGIVGPKTLQKLNEFSVSTSPAIPAIPAIPGVSTAIPAIPAIPASPALPLQPASSSQPIVIPATPAIPAIPAVPGVSTAIPAVPAIPASPASGSATKTPTPTPTPAPTTPLFTLTTEGGPGGQIYSGQLSQFGATVTVRNLTCRFTSCDSPPTTVKVYFTAWYPNGLPNIEVGPHYSEKIFSVPSIPGWGQYQFTWWGTPGAAGKYYFVSVVDPDNSQGMYRGGMRSEFTILQSSSTLTPTPTPAPTPTPTGSVSPSPIASSSATKTPTPTPTVSSQYTSQGIDGTWCIDGDYGLSVTDGIGGRVHKSSSCQDQSGTYYDYCSSGNFYLYDYDCHGLEAGGNYPNTLWKNVKCDKATYQVIGTNIAYGGYTCSGGGLIKAATPTPTLTLTPTPTPVLTSSPQATPAPTSSVSFSPDSSQISAMANILNALKSVLQTLSSLIP